MPETPQRAPDWTRDELILVCDVMIQRGLKRIMETEPAARELSDLLRRLPLHRHEIRPPNFRSANSVSRKSVDLETSRPEYQRDGRQRTNGGKLDKVVLAEFKDEPVRMHQAAAQIRAAVNSGTFTWTALETADQDELAAPEGRLLARQHMVRERDRKLRDRKVKDAWQTAGRLACEICEFDFARRYGERGNGYIECHHVVPLHAAGPSTTILDDLILICANCHRMIHRGSPWLSPDEVRALVDT